MLLCNRRFKKSTRQRCRTLKKNIWGRCMRHESNMLQHYMRLKFALRIREQLRSWRRWKTSRQSMPQREKHCWPQHGVMRRLLKLPPSSRHNVKRRWYWRRATRPWRRRLLF
mmetsp:Transcript_199/g.445  ORF Transcript_199/g.445 Transcript_199/m.445 type:complete len:112 (+) Transcript_199:1548-1883(+)